ncbi:hypothetical protein CLV63_101506 [Murinocardiopsis flavida]|uniref:Uncharacterized protein n=1 Tax=Murinocardiopsis flavida TaxID=645275 RepID=A0A2P8DV22_9ACTN|nr:hypothetical protein [Murinocardiopsis flavida]PSL01027.1 hypothetical protein CLV63_101506 [Murinocardiopsis flavida]
MARRSRSSGRRAERGASVTEYGAAVVLAAVILGGLAATDIPGNVARACQDALCRLTGGTDCAKAGPAVAPKVYPPDYDRDPDKSERPKPVRPPITPPACADPDADIAWAEGLHAHNDYQNGDPLDDALKHGATGVETDVKYDPDTGHLRNTHIDYVSPPSGSLRSEYVEPLKERAEKNGGKIYPGRDEKFQLVVENKGKGSEEERREAYDQILEQTKDLPEDVELVISGGRPKDEYTVGNHPENVTFDKAPDEGCQLPDKINIDSPKYDPEYAKSFSTLNGEWGKGKCGDPDGDNKISDEEQAELDRLVDQAHRSGVKVRFWGGPDEQYRSEVGDGHFVPCQGWAAPGRQECEKAARKDAWKAQQKAGVDFVNTNHLGNGERWVRSCGEEM